VLHERDVQLAAVRRGLGAVIPLGVLSLLTASEFELLVAGSGDWNVSNLKKQAIVSTPRGGEDQRAAHTAAVEYLWQMLEEMTSEEKALFCLFARGSSRMPADCAGVKLKLEHDSRGPEMLPVAHTCFFAIDLPGYTSKEMWRTRFLTAFRWCNSFQMG